MNKRGLLVVAILVIGVGGYWAYGAYQEEQRMKAWESLLNDPGCDACAARKTSIAKKQEERKAKALEEQGQ